MKHSVVTTFNEAGYEVYGRRCIRSFIEFWPKEVDLHVITEDVEVVQSIASNVKVFDQKDINPRLIDFKNKFRSNPHATGFDPKGSNKQPSYLWDAVRFSNKVFAVTGLFEKISQQYDQLIWLDADTVTHSSVPLDFLDRFSPKNNQLTAYLNRSIYPECGWVGYNLRHEKISAFMKRFEEVYTSGEFLNWVESHDSYVFWQVMKEFESQGCDWKALGDPSNRNHVFINSELGAYMDHLKGPRKIAGRSRPTDLVKARKEDWWKGMK